MCAGYQYLVKVEVPTSSSRIELRFNEKAPTG